MLNRAVVQPDPVVALAACGRHHGGGRRGRVARRPVPAPRGCRGDASDRHRRRSHDGEDTDARRLGARSAPHHRERRSPRTHQARDRGRDRPRRRRRSAGAGLARRALRRFRTAVPAAGSPLGSGQDPARRRSAPASRASARRSPASWKQPATTTGSATGCVRPTPSPTTPPAGRRCRFVEPWRRAPYGAEPDIAAWANGCALNPARIEPSQRDEPAVQAAAARLADVAEHGLTRMADLAARAAAERSSRSERETAALIEVTLGDERPGVGSPKPVWVPQRYSSRLWIHQSRAV